MNARPVNLTQNPYTRLWELGYHKLTPVIPPGAPISERSNIARRIKEGKDDPRGKVPGVRYQDGTWGSFPWHYHETLETDLGRWHAMGAGVGVRGGEQPDGSWLVGIDADTVDPELAALVNEHIERSFGLLPVRVGRAPKALHLLRVEGRVGYSRVEFSRDPAAKGKERERVEILGEGKHFVAAGTHPGTMQPYRWTRALVALAQLPVVSAAALSAFLDGLRDALPNTKRVDSVDPNAPEVDQATLTGKPELIKRAINLIPNTFAQFPTRDDYLAVGYAIKASLPDDEDLALDLFQQWCGRYDEYTNDPDVAEADFVRMKPPFRRGASWLYRLAQDAAPAVGETFNAAALEHFETPPSETPEGKAAAASKVAERAAKFKFLDFDDAADRALDQSNVPLIKGLIDQGTLCVLYGDSNVGKSFVAMDLGFHVGAGLSYAGMKTVQGLVVYVAAEGGNGAKRRVMALREKYGEAARGVRFKLLPMAVDLRRADADLPGFVAALKGLGEPISMIIVDTLSRALAGGDENSPVDMGAIVKHFDVIRDATGAHLMVVHHTGKNKANGARGHSLLRAATDTEIEIEDGVITVTKQRDLEKSWTSGFSLEVRRLGLDADFDPITSCTVKLLSVAEVKESVEAREPTLAEARVLVCLRDMVGGLGVGAAGVTLEQLNTSGRDELAGMSADVVRFHMRNLKEKKHVVQPKRGFWALNPEAPVVKEAEAEAKNKNGVEDLF